MFLDNLMLGFGVAFSPVNLLYCVAGVTLGTFIGVLPGLGPIVTISMLLPLTFGLPPEAALIMLAGIFYGAMYGGSTAAILLNLPGVPTAAVVCLDGYPMARQGRAGPALATAAIASVVAGIIGTFLIALFAPPLTTIALRFSAPEYFSLVLMALCGVAALSKGSLLKGVSMAFCGVLVGIVGIDISSGVPRYTFGTLALYDGIHFIIVAMGLFAFAEIISNLETHRETGYITSKVKGLMPTRKDLKAMTMPILRGTAFGSFFGILPGAGATTASFAAYMFEKRSAKDPSRFGHGAIEGVAAPEAANNASAQASFIPTLTLGIPGSATMALMLGALMIHGINPGPRLISDHPELFWGLVASMLIGNIILVILNLPLIRIWVLILRIPYRWLYPAVVMFACVGIFIIDRSAVDLWLAAGFGLLGYILLKLKCEPAPFVLGMILGPMLEENFRRAMVVSSGDPMIFVTRPISAAFLILTVLFILSMFIKKPGAKMVTESETQPSGDEK